VVVDYVMLFGSQLNVEIDFNQVVKGLYQI
jgi:hypothetical protein